MSIKINYWDRQLKEWGSIAKAIIIDIASRCCQKSGDSLSLRRRRTFLDHALLMHYCWKCDKLMTFFLSPSFQDRHFIIFDANGQKVIREKVAKNLWKAQSRGASGENEELEEESSMSQESRSTRNKKCLLGDKGRL